MGQWHVNTLDVAATKRFFVTLGGVAMAVTNPDIVRFHGVDVYLHAQAPTGGTVGTVVNHVGFSVPNIQEAADKWTALGVPVEPGNNGRKDQRWITTPDKLRIYILEAPGDVFTFDGIDPDPTPPIQHHHIHFFVVESEIPKMQAWYAKLLGAKPGMRANFQAADIPGANLTFGAADKAGTGTKGSALDHITFRVSKLEPFTKRLEAEGIKLAQPYARNPRTGGASAFLTDPWGTSIELTEMIAP